MDEQTNGIPLGINARAIKIQPLEPAYVVPLEKLSKYHLTASYKVFMKNLTE